MTKDFEFSNYAELIREARRAFLADSAYAIAVARPAGALVARRKEREVDESSSQA